MFRREDYSRRATRDVRSAAALTLARHLAKLEFNPGGQHQRFTNVFDEWPAYLDRYLPPVACVLPAGWTYGAWSFTPTLIEDTWEPQGAQGFGLYKTAELECEMEVSLRTTTPAEREAIVLAIEDAFQDPQMLMSQARGPRNSVILPMPEYYGLTARFSLQRGRTIDDPDSALRERRDAVMTVSVQANKVKLGPVFPMALHLTKQSGEIVVDSIPPT
jgi:hypothetical protein